MAFNPSFNPLQNFQQGFQSGQQTKLAGLRGRVAEAAKLQGFDPTTNLDFQQWSVMDPSSAAQMAETFESLDSKKKKRYFNDMRQGRQLLEANDKEGFLNLFSKRLNTIEKEGGDSAGTKMVLDRFIKGDYEGIINGLKSAELAGIEGGFLTDPLDRQLKQAQLDKIKAPSSASGSKRVQNSREVEGGTLITFADGEQMFKPFSQAQIDASESAKQMRAPKLTAALQTEQLNLQKSANESFALADKTSLLANKFANLDVAGGAAGSGREALLSLVGGEDELSLLRKDFTRIRNKLITKGLPQGPATDKDIELIAEGFLKSTANPQQIANFLKAMSRGQEAIAKFDEFQSVFLQENGNITKAVRNFTYDGHKIKKGERLRKAYKRIAKDIRSNIKEEGPQEKRLEDMTLEELQELRSRGGG